jgi:uncharacterized protein (DUF433 family)
MRPRSHNFQFIESDPEVCHGQWVFKGTRILVYIVLEQIESGMSLQRVIGQWHGKVTLAGLEEALRAPPEVRTKLAFDG